MAHTNGPWCIARAPLRVVTDSGQVICALYYRAEFDECQANARLIAAAPDLLEALKEVRQVLLVQASLDAPDYGWREYVEKEIDPAIAKATKG